MNTLWLLPFVMSGLLSPGPTREQRLENAVKGSEWTCEYKDSGLVKRVWFGDISRLCVSGTEHSEFNDFVNKDGPMGPE